MRLHDHHQPDPGHLLCRCWLVSPGPGTRRSPPLARAVTVTAIVGAPLMVLANYVLLGSVFDLPPRYGLTLLPLIAICTASAVRSVAGRALLGNLCALCCLRSR